jgi:hypothetical protein
MPERKNHQDSKEYGGSPLRFKMSIPTFNTPSLPTGFRRNNPEGQVVSITKK